jgi:hypothetical protein
VRIPTFKPDVKNLDNLRQQLITLQDNINRALEQIAYTHTFELTLRPEDLPRRLANPLPKPCWGLKSVYCRNLTDDTASPMTSPFVDWFPEAGGIKIRSISDLVAGNLYQIRLIAYA